MQITADGKLVMCHDEGFTLNEEGKIVLYDSSDAVAIRDLTEAECLNLRHAGTNSPICSFEEYIKICKEYDKIAYITVRDKYTDELIPEMVRILQQYEMVDRCIVNSFTYATLKAVRAAAPSVVLSYVLPYKTGITVDNIDDAVDLGNCLVCGFNFSAGSTVEDVKEIIDTSVVQYAQEKGVPLYEAQVHSMEIANELEKYGYSGAQMMKAPTVD